MKIRTRLLLFLLPTLVGSITLIAVILTYNWHTEIVDGFKTRLRAAVTTAALHHNQNIDWIRKEFSLTGLRFVPVETESFLSLPPITSQSPFHQDEEKQVLATYAPVHDATGAMVGVIEAEVALDLIEEKFHECVILILISAIFTVLILTGTLYFIANKISRPVQKLNNSALAIAAGQYGESIQVQGPKEIAELANTLNTMSQCLHENINRLQENSVLREQMYGEYECAMLMQHLMLQKNIENCKSDAVAIKPITFFSENPKGLLLDFPKIDNPDLFHMHMVEASKEGFEGMYQLLTRYKYLKLNPSHTSIQFNRAQASLQWHGARTPLVWSSSEHKFIEDPHSPTTVESGDLFFLCNHGCFSFYRHQQKLIDCLTKVLKIFAQDGLETTVSMLAKEISFAVKRKDLNEDIHILCFQILDTRPLKK